MEVSVDLPPPPTVGQVSPFVLLNRKCFARTPSAAGTVAGQQELKPSVSVAVVVQQGPSGQQEFCGVKDPLTFVWTSFSLASQLLFLKGRLDSSGNPGRKIKGKGTGGAKVTPSESLTLDLPAAPSSELLSLPQV